MALFVVRHQHAAERCPAEDPDLGAMLLNHLRRPNVRQHGVEIQGEAIVENEHTLYLILEADDEDHLRAFMKPLQMVGSLDIYPASTCARVVASGGCGAAMPVSEFVSAVDPEEACVKAIEAGLIVHRAHPLNCETSIPALIGGVVMPNAHFYVRNHFQIPILDAATFRLTVGGLVERPLSLSLHDLHNMPSQTLVATLECAGNGRTKFQPAIQGEKWDQGAVSTAEWTGVPLAEVLDRAGVRTGTREVLFRGADGGMVEGRSEPIRFERSLQLGSARDPDLLLAYAMNGEPLPIQHGYPVRLLVPDWYAVASVKWLTEIELIDQPFAGYYQSDKYWYECERDSQAVREPVTLQRVRSLITEPAPNQEVPCGELAIRGVAWSGAAPIAHVEISVGGGSWQEAHLVGERKRHSWQWWELISRVHEPGVVTLSARATDLAGRTQPEHAEWNRLGYGNNAIHHVPIRIV
ncbi:sulfite oxidase [Burkholderia sp. Ac-20353]|uniref:sulfite oxidase n=1 Tax=Burkholderia sp. Ac-20353 TaxID=2703894 RepID=UPI00197CA3E3|nr:sulfite oxidase [Burkholderia sp. Ac-20353]MBN3786162.1 sulfite oxidase [Burkholderia sp. Ac-20353]